MASCGTSFPGATMETTMDPEGAEKIEQLNAVLSAYAELLARASGHPDCSPESCVSYCEECRLSAVCPGRMWVVASGPLF